MTSNNNFIEDNIFPLMVFPPQIQKIIEEQHDERLFPIEYLGSAILFVCSVIIGSTSHLWTTIKDEYANIFVAIIGPQGSNKSAPLEWALAPLHEVDHAAIMKHKVDLAEYNQKSEKYRMSGDESDNPGDPPICKRLLLNDTTPEVLMRRLSENPEGIGQYHDELTRLLSGMGRYNKENEEDLLLSLFSMKPITIDRVSSEDTQSVLKPYYCMIGTIQPKRFIEIMKKEDRYESGLFARLLEAPNYSNEPFLWNLEGDLPSDVDIRYRNFITAMLAYRKKNIATESGSVEYRLSPDATFNIQEWQRNKEIIIAQSGTETDRAVFRKIQLYVLKFALIIQVMWDVAGNNSNDAHQVGFESAVYASILCDYFYSNAKDLARSLNKPKLSNSEIELYDALPMEFTSDQGRDLALRYGLGKTCYFEFINKVKGKLIDRVHRGVYKKRSLTFSSF